VFEIRIRRVTRVLPGFAMNYIIPEEVRRVPSFSRIVTRSYGLRRRATNPNRNAFVLHNQSVQSLRRRATNPDPMADANKAFSHYYR
jgi:hypothetical protein